MLSLYEQIGIFVGVMLMFFMVPTWMLKFSKRLKVGDTVVHFFNPPEDISILEVGYFYDSKMYFSDVLAWLIDLKNRGFIEFHKNEDDVKIVIKDKFESGLDIENNFWTSLIRDKSEISLRYVLENYNRLLLPLTFNFMEDLRGKGYLKKKKNGGVLIGGCVGVVGYFLGASYLNELSNLLLLFGFGLCGGGSAWVIWNIPKMTEKGKLLYKDLMGFQDYLKVAESDREKFRQSLETKKAELEQELKGVSNLEFSDFLPYMIILNVDKLWFETLIPELKDFVKGEGEIVSRY